MTKKGRKQSPDHVRKRIDARLTTLKNKPKPVSKEWLEWQYNTQHRDCVQIGAALGRDPKTIWSWLKHYGIETRPRGGTTCPKSFRPGQPNGFAGKRHTPETRERLRQIAKADGRVPYDPALGSYMKGRRGAEHPQWKGGITPERQSFYASDEWREAVKAVWRRDNAICQRCGLDHRKVDRKLMQFTIHHIVGFAARELRAEVSNLVLLCWPCHRFVHSRMNVNRLFLGDEA